MFDKIPIVLYKKSILASLRYSNNFLEITGSILVLDFIKISVEIFYAVDNI